MSDTNDTAKKLYDNLVITPQENSEVEIEGELTLEAISSYEEKTLKKMAKDVELPGFRKGHVPVAVIKERMSADELLREIAEELLAEVYPEIVLSNNLDVISRPAVSLTKVVPGNPIGFKIRSAVMPEVALSDYKKIAEEERKKKTDPKELEVSEEEITKVLADIRQREAHAKWHADNPDAEGHDHDIPESEWPELTDEMVQKLGDFKNIDDLKEKLKKNMVTEKEQKANDKKRSELLDALVKDTTVSVPSVFTESELDQMANEFQGQLSRMGLTWEGYLDHAKKTEEDIREEWKPDAEKRAKIQLILNEIAKKEELKPDTEKVAQEVAHIMEHYTDADEGRVKTYVESMLTNQKVFEFLEGK